MIRALWIDVWDGIRSQTARTGLSLLAIAIGIAALAVLLAVLGGLHERSQVIVRELGFQVFGVAQSESPPAGKPRLNRGHVDLLQANLPHCLVSGMRRESATVAAEPSQVQVIATDSALARVRGWTIQQGRFLDDGDLAAQSRVAVLGAGLARTWGKRVGEVITLRTTPFRIVGLIEAGGRDTSEEVVGLGDRVVFIPGTTPAYWRKNGPAADAIDAVFVRAPEDGAYAPAVTAAGRLLAQPDRAVAGLSWITPELLLSKIRRLQRMIRWTAGSIAGLCLVLGGTTLMSLMVANVRDRVTEIGLRRALGATRRDIMSLFVLESLLITGIAAIAGTTAANLILLPTGEAFPIPVQLGANTVLVPIIAALFLGVLFSYWPARFAAHIAPAEALRNE
jgi:putative ABC transport system permease protein